MKMAFGPTAAVAEAVAGAISRHAHRPLRIGSANFARPVASVFLMTWVAQDRERVLKYCSRSGRWFPGVTRRVITRAVPARPEYDGYFHGVTALVALAPDPGSKPLGEMNRKYHALLKE